MDTARRMIDLKVGTKGASHAASQHKVASIKQNINFWLAVMGKGGMTCRALSEKTGIEIASLCAALKSGERRRGR